MLRFDLIMAVILRHEGGYVNDPDDLGGETKYGITKRRYPTLDIKNLTKAEAVEIYRRDFYIPMGIDSIPDINLALNVMDMGVNASPQIAQDMLRKAVETANRTGVNVVDAYKELRIAYYTEVSKYRNNKKFLAGWINRVNSSNIA